jgi:hypothetical protein
VCVFVPPINLWIRKSVFVKLGVYIMNPEHILKAWFINHPVSVRVTLRLTVSQSVCLGVEPTLWTFDQILLPFYEFGSGICCLYVCCWATVAWKRYCWKVYTTTRATIEELLGASFRMQSVSYQRKVGDLFFSELLTPLSYPIYISWKT